MKQLIFHCFHYLRTSQGICLGGEKKNNDKIQLKKPNKQKKNTTHTQKGFKVHLKQKEALGNQFDTFGLSSHSDML